MLRERRFARDNRLRVAYLDRIRRTPGTSSALIDAGGRVLLALPAAWIPATVTPPDAPGPFELSSGGRVSLRHAEALTLLPLHPDGMTAEQLTLHLYGEHGKPVSTRALMSRLRALLGACLAARPYRLMADVDADVLEVRAARSGEPGRAVARYRGPLLADSEVERIVAVRGELAAAVRRAAIGGSPETLWTWLDTDHGHDDPGAMQRFLQITADEDPRRAVITSRMHPL